MIVDWDEKTSDKPPKKDDFSRKMHVFPLKKGKMCIFLKKKAEKFCQFRKM